VPGYAVGSFQREFVVMVRSVCLGVLLTLLAVPAFAANVSCAKTVYPPDVMRPGPFAQQSVAGQKKTLEGVLDKYARYEADLKDYRNCINAAYKETKYALNKATLDNKDSDVAKQKAIWANLGAQWNASVDEETHVVGDMTALAKIYCAQNTDPGICRKFKL
jgi:hypothetical protein